MSIHALYPPMNTLRPSALSTHSTYLDLSRKIRNAEEPDNAGLIHQFLALKPPSNQCSKSIYRTHLHMQFQLLLDTVADEYLPPHWRGQCLNHIYRPLYSLQRIVDCENSKQQVRSLRHELRIISHYFQARLSS